MKYLFFFIAFASYSNIFGQKNYENILDPYTKDQSFSGVVLIAREGKIELVKTVGYANREKKIPINIKTKFKVASVTKVFTALLIMKLVEEGILNVEQTIGKYLPDYKGEGKDKVTIHHLLTYSSGIENILDSNGVVPFQTKMSIDDFIDKYCSGKLISEPGSSSNYGNTEYVILHKIIEVASGKSYDNYLKEIILKPIKLLDTGICYSNKNIKNLTESYTFQDEDSTPKKDAPYLSEMYFGSASMYSTAEDLLKLDQAIFTSKILNQNSTKILLKINEDLGYTAYGMWGSKGWGNFSEKFYYRTGGILGSTSNWIHTDESKMSIIILSNNTKTNLFELTEKLYLAAKGKH